MIVIIPFPVALYDYMYAFFLALLPLNIFSATMAQSPPFVFLNPLNASFLHCLYFTPLDDCHSSLFRPYRHVLAYSNQRYSE